MRSTPLGSSRTSFRDCILSLGLYTATGVVCLAVFLATPQRSVSHHYEQAARNWMAGEPLYAMALESGHGFLYLPQAAILHIPYALVSKLTGNAHAGDVAWRCFSWLVFCLGLWRIGELMDRAWSQQRLPIAGWQWRIAVIGCLLSVSALRIGQSTLLMGGLMMLGIHCWSGKKWNATALLLALAIACKPLAVVLALLVSVISPPMRWRAPLAIVALLAAPLFISLLGPGLSYAIQQYLACFQMLQTAAEIGNNFQWAQLFGMLSVLGIAIPDSWQTLVRLLFAVLTLAICWVGVRKWTIAATDQEQHAAPTNHGVNSARAGLLILSAAMVYLMLFNPRTENSTYCLMAPVFATVICSAAVWQNRQFEAACLFSLVVLTAGSYEIGKYLTPADATPIWLAPLCSLVLVAWITVRVLLDHRVTGQVSAVHANT